MKLVVNGGELTWDITKKKGGARHFTWYSMDIYSVILGKHDFSCA